MAQGHTLLTISAFTGQTFRNREGKTVLAIQMLLDRPQGQSAPAADVYVRSNAVDTECIAPGLTGVKRLIVEFCL